MATPDNRPSTLADVLELCDKYIADSDSGTTITKIREVPADVDRRKGIYRISVPVPPMPPAMPEGFTFNQFLLVDDQPLLYHTGTKGMFPLVCKAIETVIPVSSLAYIGYAHAESDECGAMNELLAAAPAAVPVCSQTEVNTFADNFARPAKALADGEELSLGRMCVKWLWTPHTPHGWGTGFLFETATATLFVGDLFAQHGAAPDPVRAASRDLESLKLKLYDITDYWVWHAKSPAHMKRLQALQPQALAIMHGSSFVGQGCGDMLAALGAMRASLDAP